MVRVLLIIPAYNEEANILSTVNRIRDFSPERQYQLRYIVIDDGSTDHTRQICREHRVPCLSLIHNLGIGGAVQSGYRYAEENHFDVAVQFDGDGQHDIRCLDALITPILERRADFVIGSRFFKNGTSAFQSTALRRVGIRYLSLLIRLFCGVRVSDPTSGFRAASARAISFLAHHYPIDYPEPESIVALKQNHFSIEEVAVNMFERNRGKSSIDPWRSVYYMLKVSLAIICISLRGKERGNVTIS